MHARHHCNMLLPAHAHPCIGGLRNTPPGHITHQRNLLPLVPQPTCSRARGKENQVMSSGLPWPAASRGRHHWQTGPLCGGKQGRQQSLSTAVAGHAMPCKCLPGWQSPARQRPSACWAHILHTCIYTYFALHWEGLGEGRVHVVACLMWQKQAAHSCHAGFARLQPNR